MSEKQEQTEVQEPTVEPEDVIPSEQPSSDTEFDGFHDQALDPESDFDLEEEYLNKLKIQRKRIEELSNLLTNNQDRIQREVQKNRTLQDEIQRLSSSKEYESRYTEVMSSLEITSQENKSLKDQLGELKQELLQSSSEKGSIIQKLRMDLTMQREKENSKIQHLQDELANKQEQLDRLTRDQRNRERELQDSVSSLKSKLSNMQQEHNLQIKNEQRKVQRLERDLQSRNSTGKEAELNAEALLKENVQLKEENYRLKQMLGSKDMEFKSQFQKYKIKLNSMKKDFKAKEKECSEFKETVRKYEKESSQYTSETESLKIEIRKIRDSFQNDKSRWQSDFSKERQSFQLVIDRQSMKIMELQANNKFLLQENKRLGIILKKKQNSQKQRKYLLKTEMKQIDKLEKVIDKIVD